MAENKPVLGYWKIRGLAEPIRLLLWHLDVDYEEVYFEQGDAPHYSREQWLAVKDTLGLQFPNLPYFLDSDYKVTQSFAIAKYIVRKWRPEYFGVTDHEKEQAWVMEGVFSDIKSILTSISYAPDYNQHKRDISVELLKTQLSYLADWLNENTYAAGAHITYLDFFFFELLDNAEAFEPGVLNNVNEEVYTRYLEHIRSLHRVREFESRPRMPFNNKIASWNK